MQQRRGTAEQWESVNPVLAAGEIGFETDTNKFKIGDGVNDWGTLVYFLDADSSGGQTGDFIPTSEKAQPDGVATLDVNGQVPANQLGNASVDLSGYATEGYVDDAISNIPPTDLSGYATEQYVNTAIDNVVGLAPEDLNTLSELADALGDNPAAITTLQSDVAALQASSGGDLSSKADLVNGFVDPAQLDTISSILSNYVAISTIGTAVYSTNGISWTVSTLPGSAYWTSVAYGNNRFVAIAEWSTVAAYSTDGMSWTQTTMPTPSGWKSVAYGDGKFVAVSTGDSGSASSTDGITWTQTTMPGSFSWTEVAYGDGKFVAVAMFSSASAYSTNGTSWTYRNLPTYANWTSVTYGDGKFVAVVGNGDSTVAAYSTDGVSWTESTMPASSSWTSVTYGDGKFVAVSSSFGIAAYSTNGVDWTQTSLSRDGYWYSVTYGDGKFVAVDFFSALADYSTDGINWTSISLSRYGNWASVVSGSFITAPKIASETYVDSSINSALATKADTNSPTFTGLTDFEGIVDFSEAVVIGIDSLPNQDNNSGKYLTTNGNVASWQVIPAQTPHPFSMIG